MLRKKAGYSGSAPMGVTDLRCAPGFVGIAARDASDRLTDLSYETIKVTALGKPKCLMPPDFLPIDRDHPEHIVIELE
jgi:hypothetical protein